MTWRDRVRGQLSAVILTGGRGSRLGGTEKALIVHRGSRLIDLALAAVKRAGARQIVVVGDTELDDVLVQSVREDPPFGGPLAALEAGLAALDASSDWVLLLACDLPYVDEACELLLENGVATEDESTRSQEIEDGVCVVDESGYAQYLIGIYRIDSLRANLERLRGGTENAPLRRAFEDLKITFVPDTAGVARDIDTPADLDATRSTLSPR